jgi:disulfide bond formation protein DsbB
MLPCPLCVIQRYLFLASALFALFAAAGRPPLRRAGAAWRCWRRWAALGRGEAYLYVLAHPASAAASTRSKPR